MQKYNKDDIIQVVHNLKVVSHQGNTVEVTDVERGMNFEIIGKALIDTALSADHSEKTEKLGKTALAEVLVKSNGRVLTVNFNKDDGTERVLRGVFQSNEPLMGRSYVLDLDKNDKHPRLVNHRSINWIVLDGIKYVKK